MFPNIATKWQFGILPETVEWQKRERPWSREHLHLLPGETVVERMMVGLALAVVAHAPLWMHPVDCIHCSWTHRHHDCWFVSHRQRTKEWLQLWLKGHIPFDIVPWKHRLYQCHCCPQTSFLPWITVRPASLRSMQSAAPLRGWTPRARGRTGPRREYQWHSHHQPRRQNLRGTAAGIHTIPNFVPGKKARLPPGKLPMGRSHPKGPPPFVARPRILHRRSFRQ